MVLRRLLATLLLAVLLCPALSGSAWAQASGPTNPAPWGTLRVTSTPLSAPVYLDGEFAGLTPLEVQRKPGDVQVRVLLEGYAGESRTVAVAAGEVSDVVITLVRAAILVVRTTPPGADLFVDGEKVGVTPAEVSVSPGVRTVELRKEGHEPWVEEINLGATDRRVFTVPLAFKYGKVEVYSSPRGASVFLDGELRGKTSPLLLEQVVPGPHELRLTLPTYEDRIKDILVERGETLTVAEKLSRTMEYVEKHRAGRAARNNLIRKSVRFTSLTVGAASAIYAVVLNREVQDRWDRYQRTGFAEQALTYRQDVLDSEEKRNFWGGLATLSLSMGVLTFVF
jgi:hypothetical protein